MTPQQRGEIYHLIEQHVQERLNRDGVLHGYLDSPADIGMLNRRCEETAKAIRDRIEQL